MKLDQIRLACDFVEKIGGMAQARHALDAVDAALAAQSSQQPCMAKPRWIPPQSDLDRVLRAVNQGQKTVFEIFQYVQVHEPPEIGWRSVRECVRLLMAQGRIAGVRGKQRQWLVSPVSNKLH